MKCPKCQFENPKEMQFCGKCGARLERICPECNFANPPEFDFCGKCGHALRVPSEQLPKDLSFDEKLEKIQRYLPGGLTEKILAQRGKIEGERKQVTVMFCDMEGFTSLSGILSVEKVYSIMDDVFETLIHKVNEFGGTVNKMTGDGIMALFGAPIALEDAPQRAIRSGLAIQREIAKLSDHIKAETGTPIRMRIGIHTGRVVVGSLGNDLRVEFTAVGDTVNLASRMEGLAEPGTVYVTGDTFKLTEGLFRFEALGERQIKGKDAPVKAYRVIAPSTSRTRFDVSAERGLTPFLGRQRELELLLDGLDRAKSGRGQAFSIMGEAGVGKSRLLYEFRKAIANEDVTFIEGRCLSYSTNVAYHAVIDLLKSTFDIHEGDGDKRISERVKRGLKEMKVDEASILPFVLELLSVKESGIDALGLSPEARKDRALEALNRIVLKGSEMRPLVVAVEDLHWVDRSSEEAFKNMLDAISGAQLLLIFTYRPEFVHTWGGKSYHNQVNLNRLSNRETLAMASYILGTEVIGEDLEELILNKTEGIPFFVEEFMKSLKDLGMIEWKDSGYYLAKDISEVAIPSTIQDVIMARVDSLPEGAKNVLQTGSAIGREFSCELIKRVTGLPTQEMTPHLSVLRDSELLYERGIFPQATYIFRHSLTQEVAYDSLLLKRRKEIHERIGKAMEELYPDRLEEFYEALANHYLRGESWEKAAHYLRFSADKAGRSYSLPQAYGYYREALRVLGRLPDTEQNKRTRLDIALLLAPTALGLSVPEGSIAVLEEGVRIAGELGDRRASAQLYGQIGTAYAFAGNDAEALRFNQKAFDEAEILGDQETVGSTAFSLVATYSVLGDVVRAADVAGRAVALLEKTGKMRPGTSPALELYADLLLFFGAAKGVLGDFDEAEALCNKAINCASQTANPLTVTLAHWVPAMVAGHRGRAAAVLEHAREMRKLSEKTQFIIMLGYSSEWEAWGHYYQDDLPATRECAEKAVSLDLQHGAIHELSTAYLISGWVSQAQGNLPEARCSLERALSVAQENHQKHFEGYARMSLGRLVVEEDSSQIATAEQYILEGMKMVEDLRIRPWQAFGHVFLGETYAIAGQKDKALASLKKARQMCQEMSMDYWLTRAEKALERLRSSGKGGSVGLH